MSKIDRLSKRIDRIEGWLEPQEGPCLRWPNGDGTFIEIPGCRSLNDPKIVMALVRPEAALAAEE